jgi:hypothetical protein
MLGGATRPRERAVFESIEESKDEAANIDQVTSNKDAVSTNVGNSLRFGGFGLGFDHLKPTL